MEMTRRGSRENFRSRHRERDERKTNIPTRNMKVIVAMRLLRGNTWLGVCVPARRRILP